MSAPIPPRIVQPSDAHEADWFEEWFGEDYLRTYQHRDENEAERMIDLIASHVNDSAVKRVLDLACGAGRHSKLLCERWWTVGLDLSAALLKVARRESPDAPYIRADMRELPFADETFDLVVNLFTSFGYFEEDAEHVRVLRCVRAAMRSGGVLVIDFFNARQIEADLVPYDERTENGITIEQRRAITADGRFVEKKITLPEKGREYVERVRLFTASDLSEMVESAGFKVVALVGDYSGARWTEESPRAIVFGARR